MGLFSWGNKDFGDCLPEDDAELKEEVIHIEAKNQKEADKKCKEEAEAYDGIEVKTEPKGKGEFDCKFKFWG